MSAASDLFNAVIRRLRQAGIDHPEIIQGRHLKIRWMSDSGSRCVILSRSPGDRRAIHNALRDLEKKLNEPRPFAGSPQVRDSNSTSP